MTCAATVSTADDKDTVAGEKGMGRHGRSSVGNNVLGAFSEGSSTLAIVTDD